MKTLSFLLFFAAANVFAQSDDLINADRPGIADGSSTVGRHVFQIETGFERDRTGGVHSWVTPTLLRYGVTQALELRVESLGYEHDDTSGWAPVSIGAKYHFHDEPSLGVIARVFAINTDHTTGDLRLAADFDAGDRWSLNPNVGFVVDSGSASATAALTVQYNISKHANIFVDAGAARSSLIFDAGGAWILGRDTQLDVSFGWGARGTAAPDSFWSAGISRRF